MARESPQLPGGTEAACRTQSLGMQSSRGSHLAEIWHLTCRVRSGKGKLVMLGISVRDVPAGRSSPHEKKQPARFRHNPTPPHRFFFPGPGQMAPVSAVNRCFTETGGIACPMGQRINLEGGSDICSNN